MTRFKMNEMLHYLTMMRSTPGFVIEPHQPLYLRAAKREAKSWGRKTAASQRRRRNRDHPLVYQYLSQKISDDKTENDWLWWFIRNMPTFPRALSLGSGIGLAEERLLRGGILQSLDVVDLSPQAVGVFQKRLEHQGLKIPVQARIGDLNFISFPENEYDFILINMLLHHIVNLEHLLELIRCTLKPEGLLLIYDFIGPNVWQWDEATLKEVGLAITLSKNRYPRLHFYSAKRPEAHQVKVHSPFESVRSEEIVPILHRGFIPVREIFTDRLLHVLLNYCVEMTDWDDPDLKRWLTEMIEWEEGLSSGSEAPPCTLWGLYRPGNIPIEAAIPWREDEILQRIGVGRWNPRGIALSLAEYLPGRDRFIKQWMKMKRRYHWY